MTEARDEGRQPRLRRRAEEILAGRLTDVEGMRPDEVEDLIHELQVHQIELELMNEQLRAAQLELQRSHDRYQDLYDAAPVGYVTLDGKGRVQRANRALAAMLGVTRERLLGQRLNRFVANADQPTFHFFQNRLSEQGTLQACDVRLIQADADPFHAHLEGRGSDRIEAPEEDAAERYRVVVIDVTQQREAHQALLQAHDNLARANAVLRSEMDRRARAERELAQVRRRLAEVQETERLLLAQELHEGAVQDLYAISFRLSLISQTLREETDDAELQVLREMLQGTTRRLQATCRQLRPPTLGPLGLAAAIQSETDHFRAAHPAIDVQLELPSNGERLEASHQLALFRLFQEALSNVASHSAARHVWVRLVVETERTLLEVDDDGRGFEMPAQWTDLAHDDQLGLAGAAERVETLGGRFEVRSTPAEGTRVRVTMPHSSDAPTQA